MAAEELALEAQGVGRRRTSRRPSPGSTRSSPRTSASAPSRATTATSSASCGAGRASTTRCAWRASTRARSSARSARRSPRAIPAQQRVSIVHGDYRLDNTVLDDDGGVRAILDWEICTLGDPLADLGLLCDYWADPGDTQVALMGASPDDGAGLRDAATRSLKAYEQASGLDCSTLPYYRAFGYWKLACILQGVYARYAAGATAGDAGPVDSFPAHVVTLAESARDLLGDAAMTGARRPRRRHRRADAHRAGARRRLRGLDRRGVRRGDRDRRPPRGHRLDARRHLRRRALLGPARAAPDGAHRRRRHRPSCGGPRSSCDAGSTRTGLDVLLLVGPEPDFHWLEFAELVVGLAERFDVRLVVGLGAFPAPAPHTRPVRLAATVPQASQHLLEKVGLVAGELEVPAGIVSALELAFADADIDAITLWARVPHYVATLPYPQASVALIEGLAVDRGALARGAHAAQGRRGRAHAGQRARRVEPRARLDGRRARGDDRRGGGQRARHERDPDGRGPRPRHRAVPARRGGLMATTAQPEPARAVPRPRPGVLVRRQRRALRPLAPALPRRAASTSCARLRPTRSSTSAAARGCSAARFAERGTPVLGVEPDEHDGRGRPAPRARRRGRDLRGVGPARAPVRPAWSRARRGTGSSPRRGAVKAAEVVAPGGAVVHAWNVRCARRRTRCGARRGLRRRSRPARRTRSSGTAARRAAAPQASELAFVATGAFDGPEPRDYPVAAPLHDRASGSPSSRRTATTR